MYTSLHILDMHTNNQAQSMMNHDHDRHITDDIAALFTKSHCAQKYNKGKAGGLAKLDDTVFHTSALNLHTPHFSIPRSLWSHSLSALKQLWAIFASHLLGRWAKWYDFRMDE